ncbi:MAG TPA: hotdog fold thioesterase [Gemmatimonadaceae bacterium]|nr:hotdog fold thioesterase [Gemmatimonadaceae bacterium]
MTTESDEQAHAHAVVTAMLAKDAFSQWLGVELVTLRPRACTLRMRVRSDMVNGFGVSHGGIVYSLADSALAFASNTNGHVTVSVDNTISYPVSVQVGDDLIAVAEEETAGARLGFYRVTVARQDGTVVGLLHATVYRTSQKHELHPDDIGNHDH